MSSFTPKGHILISEAVSRLGQSLYPGEWTGEEFAPAVASMAKINRDTQTYFIGWVAERCINVENTSTRLTRRTVENPKGGRPLSTFATEQWDRASGIYEEARSLINEIAQFESIKAGGGHLAKIWNDPKRGVIWEWPEDFPLSKDDLKALKAEEEEFRAPREAAYKRLDDAVRLLQQELCGTPPDCIDAIPALRCYPDKIPDRIDPASWIGPAGLNRLKRAARDDHPTPGRSRIIVPLERIESLCLSVKPPVGEVNTTDDANAPASETPAGEVASTKEKPRRSPRRHDSLEDAALKNSIETVLTKARSIWPDPEKQPGIDVMAKELERLHGKELGYKFEAIRKILKGTYSASERLNIPGL